MPCLVAEHIHAGEHADTAKEQCNQEQCYAPGCAICGGSPLRLSMAMAAKPIRLISIRYTIKIVFIYTSDNKCSTDLIVQDFLKKVN